MSGQLQTHALHFLERGLHWKKCRRETAESEQTRNNKKTQVEKKKAENRAIMASKKQSTQAEQGKKNVFYFGVL